MTNVHEILHIAFFSDSSVFVSLGEEQEEQAQLFLFSLLYKIYEAKNIIITALTFVKISTESFTKLLSIDCKIKTEISTKIKAPIICTKALA